jgi:xanthine dehydrogenase small subunit
MREEVVLYVNGRRLLVCGTDAFGSLTEYIRDVLRLTGTKIGCGEGDCGACTVLIGRPEEGAVRYRPVTSCILTPCLVDAAHVVTVEGLWPLGGLSPVQEAMVACHGSQCGYCTPGVVVALTGLFETNADPDEDALREGLTGNLCRCTGYLPILEAGRCVDRAIRRPIAELYPNADMATDLRRLATEPLRIETGSDAQRRIFSRPNRAEDAIAFKAAHPDAVVVAGGTDLGVWRNTRAYDPVRLLSLSGVAEWGRIVRVGETVSIGANVTWSALEEFAAREAPELAEVTRHFASPQIRHAATFVGNVANGSPIADAVGFLHVVGASVELVGPSGARTVPIGEFITGYRRTVMKPDEVVTRAVVPLPLRGDRLRLYKVSKRKEMDISTFRAAVRVGVSGGVIAHAALAFAGVGPKVIRLARTESYLSGRPFDEPTFREAGRRARAEVEPVSDVRGSRDFRLALAENVLMAFYHDCAGAAQGAVP